MSMSHRLTDYSIVRMGGILSQPSLPLQLTPMDGCPLLSYTRDILGPYLLDHLSYIEVLVDLIIEYTIKPQHMLTLSTKFSPDNPPQYVLILY
jgi:hypothetical protein